MKICIISNIGPREVTLKDCDITIDDLMTSAEELSGFQVILPVCKDRQLKDPLSETLSLQKQGLVHNSTIYCKFKLKEEEETTSETKKASSKTGNRKLKQKVSTDALSPMHIKPTVITRKRSKVSSVDKLLFSPPPPNKKSNSDSNRQRDEVVASIPKLSMRHCTTTTGGFFDNNFGNKPEETLLSPLRMIKPTMMMRKRSNKNDDHLLFSPTVAKSNIIIHNDNRKKARLEFHPTPPCVLQLQDLLDAEGN